MMPGKSLKNFRNSVIADMHPLNRKRKLDLTGASEMNRLYPNSRRESINENKYLNTLPRRGEDGGRSGLTKTRQNWDEKRMETARQNLQPEQLWKLKQEPALITDPNSDERFGLANFEVNVLGFGLLRFSAGVPFLLLIFGNARQLRQFSGWPSVSQLIQCRVSRRSLMGQSPVLCSFEHFRHLHKTVR
ncbi:hypothetical protein TNCV_385311 [Trichonephila clavipes]|nr:hypothetical protein TNCV_385311 [Trichonephila clavipes]